MRTNREFSPRVIQKLEAIQEPDLEFLLDQFAEEETGDFELTDWQIKGVEQAEKSLAEGRTISHERIDEWMKSWGTENELPMPECK